MRFVYSIVTAVAVLALALAVHAADSAAKSSPTTKPTSARLFAPYSKMSSLDDEQRSKIHDIHKKVLAEERELERKEAEEIQALLTDAQKKELREIEDKTSAAKKTPAKADESDK